MYLVQRSRVAGRDGPDRVVVAADDVDEGLVAVHGDGRVDGLEGVDLGQLCCVRVR